jgi:hypothetical protein
MTGPVRYGEPVVAVPINRLHTIDSMQAGKFVYVGFSLDAFRVCSRISCHGSQAGSRELGQRMEVEIVQDFPSYVSNEK